MIIKLQKNHESVIKRLIYNTLTLCCVSNALIVNCLLHRRFASEFYKLSPRVTGKDLNLSSIVVHFLTAPPTGVSPALIVVIFRPVIPLATASTAAAESLNRRANVRHGRSIAWVRLPTRLNS